MKQSSLFAFSRQLSNFYPENYLIEPVKRILNFSVFFLPCLLILLFIFFNLFATLLPLISKYISFTIQIYSSKTFYKPCLQIDFCHWIILACLRISIGNLFLLTTVLRNIDLLSYLFLNCFCIFFYPACWLHSCYFFLKLFKVLLLFYLCLINSNY